MELRNPLTTARGDARYVRSAWTTLDTLDNATDRIALGAAAAVRLFQVEYVLTLPVSGRKQRGEITVDHDGGTATITDHHYAYDPPEIAGLTWSAAVTAGTVELVLTKAAVGEHPSIQYRVALTPA